MEELWRAERPDTIASYAALPPSLQSAMQFAWQWEQGHDSFVVQTSGSTGPPKTIAISRQRMLVSARLTQQALQLTPRHTALLCLNADTIGGKMMLVRGLHLGMDMVWVAPTANPLADLPRSPDLVAMVPLQLQTALAETPRQLENIHAILVGGAPVSVALEEAIRVQVASPVYSTYGMTETVSHIALRRLNGPKASAAFQVLGDTRIGTDERECLTIQGEITQHQRIVTNDLVDITGPRQFRWRGRYDWVINSGGVKVSPEQVERAVAQVWNLSLPQPRFFVTGLPDDRFGQRVVLVIEAPPAPKKDEQHLLASVAREVPPYHGPKEIRYIYPFRETASGKIDRRATMEGEEIQQ